MLPCTGFLRQAFFLLFGRPSESHSLSALVLYLIPSGLPAARYQRETGTGYFDPDTQAIAPGAEKAALTGSAEGVQFALS